MKPNQTSEPKRSSGSHRLAKTGGVLAAAMALSPLAFAAQADTAYADTFPLNNVLKGQSQTFSLASYFSGATNLSVAQSNVVANATYSLLGNDFTFNAGTGMLFSDYASNVSTFDITNGSYTHTFSVRTTAAPTVVHAIPDKKVYAGSHLEFYVDDWFDNVFDDEDSNSNYSYLTASFSGGSSDTAVHLESGFLMLDVGMSTGTVLVTVEAFDNDGNSATDQFQVNIAGPATTIEMTDSKVVGMDELFLKPDGLSPEQAEDYQYYFESVVEYDDSYLYYSTYPSCCYECDIEGIKLNSFLSGTTTITVKASDSDGWMTTTPFAVHISPWVQFDYNSHKPYIHISNYEEPHLSIHASDIGTVYLVPSGVAIASANALDDRIYPSAEALEGPWYSFGPSALASLAPGLYSAYLVADNGTGPVIKSSTQQPIYITPDYAYNIGSVLTYAKQFATNPESMDVLGMLWHLSPFGWFDIGE